MRYFTLFIIVLFGTAFIVLSPEKNNKRENNFSSAACACDRMADSLVLVEFHDSLSVNATWIEDWDFNEPMHNWFGIKLNQEGCVKEIDLKDNQLNGHLISEIGNLESLEILKLGGFTSNNGLITGPIPASIGNLQILQELFLATVNLSCPIPDEIGNLSNLKHLSLRSSSFDCPIPTGIFNLTKLETLALGGFSGSVPDLFDELLNLEVLSLSKTGTSNFTGEFPHSISALIELEELYISEAPQLKGTLPVNLGDLHNLKILYFYKNGISGELPKSIGELQKLESCTIWDNKLTGTIPEEIGNLKNLKSLNLSDNNLEGEIPESIQHLAKLESLGLENNNLSGSIPEQIGSCKFLESVDFSGNNLSGPIPKEIDLIDSLGIIWLSNNLFSDSFPVLNTKKIKSINIANNLIEWIPDLTGYKSSITSWGIHVEGNKLTFEDILKNRPIGDFFYYSPQDSVFKDTTLYVNELEEQVTINLDFDDSINTNVYYWFHDGEPFDTVFGNNKLIFTVPDLSYKGTYTCEIKNDSVPDLVLDSKKIELDFDLPCRAMDSLVLIDFYERMDGQGWNIQWDFNEPIDTWEGVADLTDNGCVRHLKIQNNNLTGELYDIPLYHLEILELFGNKIFGTIPDFKNTPNLYWLALGNNMLSGEISDFCCLFNLEYLSVALNHNMSGIIPDFSNTPKLRVLNAVRCSFVEIPDFSNLKALEDLELDENQLEGELPKFENCPLLEKIRLSENNLHGDISGYDNFLNLKYLELSRNNLYGAVPDFSGLELQKLLLEYNEFDSLPNLSEIITWSDCTGNCGLQVQGNNLTFDDIIPNLPALDNGTYYYTPQDSFFKEIEYYAPLNHPYTIDLKIDATITDNQYKWFKNNDSLTVTSENKLVLNNLGSPSSDTYHCHVTNPQVPDLTLYSRGVTIHTCQPAEMVVDPVLCFGETINIRGNTYDRNNPRDTLNIDVPDSLGCDSIIFVDLTFYEESVNLIRDTITEGDVRFLNGETYNTTGTYEQVLSNAAHTGCDSTIRLELEVLPKEEIVEIGFPNAITADGDGLNDVFVIPALQNNPGNFQNNRLQVFSRQGSLLFEEGPYLNSWDGTSQNGATLPTGTYYFVFTWEENFMKKEKKGKLLLMR